MILDAKLASETKVGKEVQKIKQKMEVHATLFCVEICSLDSGCKSWPHDDWVFHRWFRQKNVASHVETQQAMAEKIKMINDRVSLGVSFFF